MKFNHLLYNLPRHCPRKEQRLLTGFAIVPYHCLQKLLLTIQVSMNLGIVR